MAYSAVSPLMQSQVGNDSSYDHFWIWGFPKMWRPQKWLIYNEKSIYKWMTTGDMSILGNVHIFLGRNSWGFHPLFGVRRPFFAGSLMVQVATMLDFLSPKNGDETWKTAWNPCQRLLNLSKPAILFKSASNMWFYSI